RIREAPLDAGDDYGAERRADQRGAPADGAPDDDREADGDVEEGRRGELHHQRVEHAGDAGDPGGNAEDEVLVGRDVVAEIPDSRLVVADRLQDEAGLAVDEGEPE